MAVPSWRPLPDPSSGGGCRRRRAWTPSSGTSGRRVPPGAGHRRSMGRVAAVPARSDGENVVAVGAVEDGHARGPLRPRAARRTRSRGRSHTGPRSPHHSAPAAGDACTPRTRLTAPNVSVDRQDFSAARVRRPSVTGARGATPGPRAPVAADRGSARTPHWSYDDVARGPTGISCPSRRIFSSGSPRPSSCRHGGLPLRERQIVNYLTDGDASRWEPAGAPWVQAHRHVGGCVTGA